MLQLPRSTPHVPSSSPPQVYTTITLLLHYIIYFDSEVPPAPPTPPGIYYDHTVITIYYTSLSIPYPFLPYPPPPSPPLPPTHPPPFPHFSNIPSPTFPLSLTPPPPLPSSLLPLLANRGKAAMVPVGIARTTGILQIEFQRQKYFYTPPNKLGSAAKEFPHGVFTLSACPTDLPLVHYTSARYDPFLFSFIHTITHSFTVMISISLCYLPLPPHLFISFSSSCTPVSFN